jgi:phosphatidate phosphatase APP1
MIRRCVKALTRVTACGRPVHARIGRRFAIELGERSAGMPARETTRFNRRRSSPVTAAPAVGADGKLRAMVRPVPLALLLVAAAATPALAKKDAHLQSYGGYATTEVAVIRGRAARGKPIADKPRGDARKVLATARAFLGRDIEHARLRVEHGALSAAVRADDEGFFEARLAGKLAAGRQRFVVLLDEPRYSAAPLVVDLEVVDGTRGVVVVSDIDDTIIDTGVTGGKLDLIARIAASDARDIVPLAGAAEALRAFAAEGVPIVYLTASPVDIGPRLVQFLELAGFPAGAIFLRHYGTHGVGNPTRYKRARFDQVLRDFPGRRLVLFGDNGEKDVDIFRALAAATGRVQAAYVRRTLPRPAPEGIVLFDEWAEVVEHARRTGTLAASGSERHDPPE